MLTNDADAADSASFTHIHTGTSVFGHQPGIFGVAHYRDVRDSRLADAGVIA
jgi:hypothetical protein